MTLANEKAMLTERLANDMAIAKMDNQTRLTIAQMEGKVQMRGQDVSQRGQDIEAGVTTRGQDISREGNILSARQGQLQFASQTDPIRQAITLVGGSGGNTPFELAAEDFRRSIPAMPKIDPYTVPVKVAAQGAVVSDREPVLMGEGTRNQGVAMGTSELMMPMANGDKRIMPQVSPGMMVYRDPETGSQYKLNGGSRMAEGGDVGTPGAPVLPSGLAALGYKTWSDVANAFSTTMLRNRARANDIKRQLPPELQGLPMLAIYSRLKQWAAGQGAPPAAPPAPPEPPAPDPTITPDDAALLPPSPYADDAAVAAAREVVRKALQGIVSGTDQPATDLNLPSVYGVNLGNPQDYAYSLPKMERPGRELLTSAFDLRGVAPDVFERRRQQYVPVAANFRTSWG